jgi:PPOX class probable F420-dependent enzyme
MINFNSEFGKRAARRLAEEEIIWLTSTDTQGSPQPRPVWFYWNGESLLIFSRPSGHKVAQIQNNPHVALNFNCTNSGSDVVVMLGTAEIDTAPVPLEDLQAYLKKYEQGLVGINMTAAEFQKSYSVLIRIQLKQLRGH